MSDGSLDVIFAGGGLAATLAAYRLRQLRPQLRILVLEAGETLGGNHAWSFHDGDIEGEARAWIAPFVAHSWPRQAVRFPKFARTLSIGYNTILSQTLHRAALELLAGSVIFSAKVRAVEPGAAYLEDGRVFFAPCVIDARGQTPGSGLTLGYQKFVGLEARLEAPHGQAYPIIMDAAVPQRDGYRFVYTLPFSADRILIEDTYYSDAAGLDAPFLKGECVRYAEGRGWRIAEILREEKGVLPVVLGGDVEELLRRNTGGVPALGLRAGFFHHTTGYSFPFAVRCADAIARLDPLTSESLRRAIEGWARRHWRDQRFFRLLNRMLFWAAKPERRYRVLERFYEMREPLIERFYASSLTAADRARILMGWPPVPIGRALRVLGEARANPLAEAASWPK